MWSDRSSLECVLGHPRVLDERGADPRWRVLAHHEGRVVGLAALEPLYGRSAELAIAIEDLRDHDAARALLERIKDVARKAEMTALRVAVGPLQAELATLLMGQAVASGELTLLLDP